MSRKPRELEPVGSNETGDADAILARRTQLMKKLRRSATAAAGVVLGASACACLSPILEPCPVDAGPDGSTRTACVPQQLDGGSDAGDGGETNDGGGARDGGRDAGRSD